MTISKLLRAKGLTEYCTDPELFTDERDQPALYVRTIPAVGQLIANMKHIFAVAPVTWYNGRLN